MALSPSLAPVAIALCLALTGCGDKAGDVSSTTKAQSSTTEVAGPKGTSTSAPGVTPVREPRVGGLRIAAVELQFEDPSPGGQSVWLANPSGAEVDASCWELASAATGERATVERGAKVMAGATLHLTAPAGLLASTDTITLRDPSGREVDRTGELTDTAFDDRLWLRGEGGVWRFDRFSPSGPVLEGRIALGSTC